MTEKSTLSAHNMVSTKLYWHAGSVEDEFKPKSYGTAGLHEWYYFAESQQWANQFAKDNTQNWVAKPYHLSILNTLDITDSEVATINNWIVEFKNNDIDLPSSIIDQFYQSEQNLGYLKNKLRIGFWQIVRFDTGYMRTAILNAGYDSVRFNDVIRGKYSNVTMVVFMQKNISPFHPHKT